MANLPKEIYRFHAISIKISMQFFRDFERTLASYGNTKPRMTKTIHSNKRTASVITISDFKLYYSGISDKYSMILSQEQAL